MQMETEEEKKPLCWGYLSLAGECSPKQSSHNFAQIVGISVWPGCRLHSEPLIPETMRGQSFPCIWSKHETVKNVLKTIVRVFSMISMKTYKKIGLYHVLYISFNGRLQPHLNIVFEHMHLEMGTYLILHQTLIAQSQMLCVLEDYSKLLLG